METSAGHLQLVFMATTITPAWGAWVYTSTIAPHSRAVVPAWLPAQFRLARRAS